MRNLIERTRRMGLRVLHSGIVSIPRRGSSTLLNLVQRTRGMTLRDLCRTRHSLHPQKEEQRLATAWLDGPRVWRAASCAEPPAGTPQPREPVVKPPLPLPLCFMLSHLEDDGPVRIDGVKLGVFEVMGLELDEPKLGAFAGALNALDFPLQLLIRQHPPDLSRMRERLQRGRARRPAPADAGGGGVAPRPAHHAGTPRRHPRPPLLRGLPVRPSG